MAVVEQKNTAQDASISSLNSRVQAIEDTPGVGQFGAGKLGTIAGSTTDGRIKAEDDGTGSVNGWSDLKTRVSTAEGQIITAQNNISALDGTVAQQTTEISGLKTDVTNIQNKNTEQDQSIAGVQTALDGKVNIAQGAENAGKALVVGEDGNVAPAEVSGGKKLYTGPLNTLILYSDGLTTVPKEFDIEYIFCSSNTASVGRTTVSKQTITSRAYLGVMSTVSAGSVASGALSYISDNYVSVYVGTYPDTKVATQLTTSEITYSSDKAYYRLYV